MPRLYLAASLTLFMFSQLAAAGESLTLTDREIAAQVQSHLAAHTELGSMLTVQTHDGVVYLGGLVTTDLARSRAEALAREIPGVRQVIDSLGLTD